MNAITIPQPLSLDADTVTLSRAAWDGLMEQIEDAADLAAVSANDARRSAIGAEQFDRECFSSEEVDRVLAGESVITVLRKRTGMTQAALAKASGVSQTYLNELERGKKGGSATALKKLAGALGVSMDVLVD